MTEKYSKDLYRNCQNLLSILSSKEFFGIYTDNEKETVNKRFESFISNQLQKDLKISYAELFDAINILKDNKHIDIWQPTDDKLSAVKLHAETTKCTITPNGQNAFRQGFYQEFINQINYTESVRRTNKNVRVTNYFIWVSIGSALFSAYFTYKLSNETSLELQLIRKQDTFLQEQTKRLTQIENNANVQQKKVDSLISLP